MEDSRIGKRMWGIAKDIEGFMPICINETKEGAIRALDRTYTLLVELEIKKLRRACVHFCSCNHKCCEN